MESNRKQAERVLENCRAGLLALKLKEGEKCPVCGSTHHPEPTGLSDKSVTEEKVEKLKRQEQTGLIKRQRHMQMLRKLRQHWSRQK